MSKPKYSASGSVYWGKSIEESYREKGPSWVSVSGVVVFDGDADNLGKKSRLLGPAYISGNGVVTYEKCGVFHRVDGPAVIDIDDTKQYWVEGVELPQVEFFAIYGVM